MADIVDVRNVASKITNRLGSTPLAWTAAGTGDNTVHNGLSIDREGLGVGSLPNSALFSVLFGSTLASGATLVCSIDVQTCSDNSSWTDYASVASTTVGTGPAGGGAANGQVDFGVNLTSAQQRYIRAGTSVPDLSAGGTDHGCRCDGCDARRLR